MFNFIMLFVIRVAIGGNFDHMHFDQSAFKVIFVLRTPRLYSYKQYLFRTNKFIENTNW